MVQVCVYLTCDAGVCVGAAGLLEGGLEVRGAWNTHTHTQQNIEAFLYDITVKQLLSDSFRSILLTILHVDTLLV